MDRLRRRTLVRFALWCGVVLISHWSLVTSHCFAAVPHLIRYQGQAVDSQGVPLEGPYLLTFRLYDAQTGGKKVWEEAQANVPLADGHFSVLLGQVTPLDVDWSQPLWLSLQVGMDPELAPRQQITSVPMAILSDTVDGMHASDLLDRANHTGTQLASTITGTFAPSAISPQGTGSGLDADMVDGKHASDLLKLNDAASGDLSGTYPNPTVGKIQGRDVLNVAPADSNVLTWVNANTRWEPKTVPKESGTWSSNLFRGSRAVNTDYQNTSGKKRRLLVMTIWNAGDPVDTVDAKLDSTSPPSTIRVSISPGKQPDANKQFLMPISIEIPNNWYYRVEAMASERISKWFELDE